MDKTREILTGVSAIVDGYLRAAVKAREPVDRGQMTAAIQAFLFDFDMPRPQIHVELSDTNPLWFRIHHEYPRQPNTAW